MKHSGQISLYVGVGVLGILTLLGVVGMVWENSRYSGVMESYTQVQRQAQEYAQIKARHLIASSQDDFDYLEKHPKLVKKEKHGGTYRFEFDNLSASEFDRITNKILNSTLIVKKMSLNKNGSSKGSISVEIES